MYEDQYHPQIKKDLKKIDKPIQTEIKENIIPIILNNPESGEELAYSLQGIYSYHFKMNQTEYRVCYFIREQEKVIYVIAIGTRENFYDAIRKRLS